MVTKIAAGIVGAFSGIITAAMHIPYGYYVMAQNLREMRGSGRSWLTIALIAIGLTPFLFCATAFSAVSQIWAFVALGAKIGGIKGITRSLMLPATLHAHFQYRRGIQRKIFQAEVGMLGGLLFDLAALLVAPMDFLFNCNKFGDLHIPVDYQRLFEAFEGNRLSEELEVARQRVLTAEREGNDAEAQRHREAVSALEMQLGQSPAGLDADDVSLAVRENNDCLIARTNALEKLSQGIVIPLTEDEIRQVEGVLPRMPEEVRKDYTQRLERYRSCETCPICFEWPSDPITVVLGDSSEKIYQADELIRSIQADTHRRVMAIEPTSRQDFNELKIYKGYPLCFVLFINLVRKINKLPKPVEEIQHFAALHAPAITPVLQPDSGLQILSRL